MLRHLLIFALAVSFDAHADDVPSMEQLIQQKKCITSLQNANSKLHWLEQTWFANPDSNVHVLSAFDSLVEEHRDYHASVENFVKKARMVPQNFDDLAKLQASLNRSFDATLADLSSIGEDDEAFLVSIATIDNAFARLEGRYASLQNRCEGFATDAVQAVLTHIDVLRQQLENMQAYVAEAEWKRVSMFRSALASIKFDTAERFAAVRLLDIDEVQAKIAKINAADEILARIHSWWYRAAIKRGLGGGLLGLYLQYTKPMHILRTDLVEGLRLKRELLTLGDVPEPVMAPIKAQLDGYIGLLDSEIQKLERSGPEAIFTQQKEMSFRRRTTLGSYAVDCEPALDKFDATAHAATEVADYRQAELAYLTIAVVCQRRDP